MLKPRPRKFANAVLWAIIALPFAHAGTSAGGANFGAPACVTVGANAGTSSVRVNAAAVAHSGGRTSPARIAPLRQKATHRGAFAPTWAPSLDGSPVEYLVLTRDDMRPEFERLAAWKTRKGVPTVVRTLQDVQLSARAGSDLAETIRNYVQDAYRFWGVRFVLLGGDTDVIPARHIEMQIDGRTPVSELYYSCLDGTWNADGDAFFGEEFVSTQNPGDEVDLRSEVFLGRAPTSTRAEARTFVDKTLEYEKPSHLTFQDKLVFLAEVLFPSNYVPGGPLPQADGATFAEQIARRLAPWTQITRMYEAHALWPGSDALSVSAATDAINSGYGIVVHVGHGWRYTLSTGDGSLEVHDAARFSNTKRCGLFYLLNCSATSFDFESIAESLLLNPAGGASAVVGAAREAYPLSVNAYQNAFFAHLFGANERQVGVAMTRSREDFVSPAMTRLDRWTQLVYTLLGDPELPIWTRASSDLRVVGLPNSLRVGAQQVVVEVHDADAPLAGALVCFEGGDEYRYARTDHAGRAQFDLELRAEGDVRLTVTAADRAPFETTLVARAQGVTLVAGDVELQDDGGTDGVGNRDGRLDAGETVQIWPRLRNAGTGTARDITATVRTLEPAVQVLQAASAYPNLSAGIEAQPTTAFVVRTNGDTPDGAVVALELEIQHSGGAEARRIPLLVHASRPRLVGLRLDDSRAGNGNGVQDAGEEVDLYYSVENTGGGGALGVEIRLENPESGLEILTGTARLPEIAPGARAEAATPLVVRETNLGASPGAQLGMTHLQNPAGDVHRIDLRLPDAPQGLAYGNVDASDVVHLMWEPVSAGDLLGYHVERAASDNGPFERVNIDVVQHAYFRDVALEPSRRYWYRVRAVDAALQIGPPSNLIAASTNPRALEGWPIDMAQFTASTPAVGDLNGDGDLELVAAGRQVFAWDAAGVELVDADRDPLTWGVLHGTDEGFGPVTVADVDALPGREIVVATWDEEARYAVVIGADGAPLPGWPQALAPAAANVAGTQVPAVVANVDGVGTAEVLIAARDGRLYGWHADGSEIVDGDSDASTHGVFLDTGSVYLLCAPGVANLDASRPGLEIVLGSTNGTLHVVDALGRALPGWPRTTFDGATSFGSRFASGIAIGDVDRDETLEMIFVDGNGRLHAMHVDGGQVQGFPVSGIAMQGVSLAPSPALGDLGGSAALEIVVAGTDGRLHVFDATGNTLLDQPIDSGAASESSPLLGDVDGDGEIEIVFGNEDGLLQVWNLDGTPVDGFPIALGSEVRATPILADFDASGTADLVVQGWDGVVRAHDLGVPWREARFPWPQHRGNANRTGVAAADLATPVLLADFEARFEAAYGVHLSWRGAVTEGDAEPLWKIRRAGPFASEPRAADWLHASSEIGTRRGVGALAFVDANLESNGELRTGWFAYAVMAVENGNESVAGRVTVLVAAPTVLRLHRPAPNPFNPGTRIVFEIPGRVNAPVHLAVYDVRGRPTRVLANESMPPGRHVVDWDGYDGGGRPTASGIYIVRLRTNASVLTQKFVRLR